MHKTVRLAEEEEGRGFYFLSAWAMKTIWAGTSVGSTLQLTPLALCQHPQGPMCFHPQW